MSMPKQAEQAATIYEIGQVSYQGWMKQRPYDRIVRLHSKRDKRTGQLLHPKPRLVITGHGNRRTKARVR